VTGGTGPRAASELTRKTAKGRPRPVGRGGCRAEREYLLVGERPGQQNISHHSFDALAYGGEQSPLCAQKSGRNHVCSGWWRPDFVGSPAGTVLTSRHSRVASEWVSVVAGTLTQFNLFGISVNFPSLILWEASDDRVVGCGEDVPALIVFGGEQW